MEHDPRWLDWARRLQSISQAGLTYSQNAYDLERFQQVQDLAAEILADHSDKDLDAAREVLHLELGYPTPKVDVRGVIFEGEKILMVRELSDGGWTLPGGWVDAGEPPSRAVEREVFEESGYQVKARKLLAVYDRSLHDHPPHLFSIYKLFFLCEITGGAPKDSHETAEPCFYPLDAIPDLSRSRTSMDELHRMYRLRDDPRGVTEFD